MTVLFFIQPPFIPNEGGVQQSTAKMATVFSQNGNDCIIVSMNQSSIEEYNGIPIIVIPNIQTLKGSKEFRGIVDRFQVNVIINQMGSDKAITKFLFRNKTSSVKLINTLRMNPLSFVQNIDFILKEKLKEKNLSFIYSRILKKLILQYHREKQNRVLNFILTHVDKYVVLNRFFIKELEYFGINTQQYAKKISAIPNMFAPVTDYCQEKRNVILYVGRLARDQKRIDLLQEVFGELHPRLSDWEFWVVGDGPYRAEFEFYCKTNNLIRVKFFGYQDPKKYYQKAKILAFTSANEGFGNVLVEAQQYGVVPVMFNSYSAAPDLVKGGLTGKLVEPFIVDEYISEVLTLVQNTELIEKHALEAINHAKQFEYEAVSKKWFELLGEL